MSNISELAKSPNETLRLTLDASEILATGDTVDAVTIVVTDADGLDVSSDMLSGDALIDSAGTEISQLITSGTSGQIYSATLLIETTNGETLERVVYIRVRASSPVPLLLERARYLIMAKLGLKTAWPTGLRDLDLAAEDVATALSALDSRGGLTSRSIEGFSESWDVTRDAAIPISARDVITKYFNDPGLLIDAGGE